jgi:hypothetical protein
MGTEKRDYVDGRVQNFNDLEIVKRLNLKEIKNGTGSLDNCRAKRWRDPKDYI